MSMKFNFSSLKLKVFNFYPVAQFTFSRIICTAINLFWLEFLSNSIVVTFLVSC